MILINDPGSGQIQSTFRGPVDPKSGPLQLTHSTQPSGRHFDPIISQESLLKMFEHRL
jgi:hypothetical protein